MNALTVQKIFCPCCGEMIEVLIDCTEVEQEYIEDCQVCCRPIVFNICLADDGATAVAVRHEDE